MLDKLVNDILNFRRERDWEQFHNPKDMAISLSLEASELLECFQWNKPTDKEKIADELADVLYWVLLMSYDMDIDILKALDEKMVKNRQKYPTEKVKGKAKKYNQYDSK